VFAIIWSVVCEAGDTTVFTPIGFTAKLSFI